MTNKPGVSKKLLARLVYHLVPIKIGNLKARLEGGLSKMPFYTAQNQRSENAQAGISGSVHRGSFPYRRVGNFSFFKRAGVVVFYRFGL